MVFWFDLFIFLAQAPQVVFLSRYYPNFLSVLDLSHIILGISQRLPVHQWSQVKCVEWVRALAG